MDQFDCTCDSDTLTDPYDSFDDFDSHAAYGPPAPACDPFGPSFSNTVEYEADLDGDGQVDSVVSYDLSNGTTTIASDTDGDGFLDLISVDLDGDGILDVVAIDTDGDGLIDVVTTPDEFQADGEFTNEFDSSEMTITDTPYDVIDDEVELDDVHGDPQAEIEFHQAQPGPVDCLPTSVSMVLSQVTGETVPASEVVALAHELDVMTDSGMAAGDAVKLFEEYGVEAEVSSGSLDDLRTALDNGDNVIIGLDSADLYNGDGGPFDEGLTAGHAVEITGIDDEAGVVYINDPGFSDGAGVEIPIEVFEDAWEDADNTMITVSADTDVDTESGGEDQGGFTSILLPLQFLVK